MIDLTPSLTAFQTTIFAALAQVVPAVTAILGVTLGVSLVVKILKQFTK